MGQKHQYRETNRRVPVGGILAIALAVGGLSAPAFVATAGAAATSVTISTTKNANLGTILVSGNTLYTLKASKTACTAQCLKVWPAVMLPKGVTKATAGKGVNAAALGTVKRGGALQVTYSGKALYRFSGDKAPGQVNGNLTDTWGKWSALVTAKSATANSGATTTTSPSTGGASF